MNKNHHPARSPDFLSRLHDGDLSPGERAHFESHRAHCSECRNSAADFEAALSLYRSSRPEPPSPDLSARILRKLQSSGRRRPLFGPAFGIDLRWAGAFAAALIAVIAGSAIVAKNEAREKLAARTGPIPVIVREAPRAPAADSAGAPPAASHADPSPLHPDSRARESGPAASPRGEVPRAAAIDSVPAPRAGRAAGRNAAEVEAARRPSRKDELSDAGANAPGSAQKVAAIAAPPAPAKESAAAPASVPSAAVESRSFSSAARELRARERAGGEGAAGGSAPEATAVPLRLVVLSLDGSSSPPEILKPIAAGLPANLRGRAFILIVDAAGRVRQLRPRGPAGALSTREPDAPAPPSLLSLRFAPGDRQRRLLLRIE